MARDIPGLSALGAAGARLLTALAFGLVALLLAVAGVVLTFAALYLWLATLLPSFAAALLTGLALFFVALLVALVGRAVAGRPRMSGLPPSAVGVKTGPAVSRPDLAAAVGSELGVAGAHWVRGHLPQLALTAAVAGFALGVSPRLRRMLWRVLR